MPRGQTTQDLTLFFSKFKWFGGVVVAACTGIVSVLVLGLGPETGRETLDCRLSSGVSIITLLIVFIFFAGASRASKIKKMRIGLIVFALCCFGYGALFSYFTELDGKDEPDRYVKGFEYTPTITQYKAIVKQKRSRGEETIDDFSTDRDLVIGYKNDPNNIWTAESLKIMAILLHMSLLLVVASFTVFLSFLLLLLPKPPQQANKMHDAILAEPQEANGKSADNAPPRNISPLVDPPATDGNH